MDHTTGQWGLAPEVTLTVRSSVWRFLDAQMDPEADALVFANSGDNWVAAVLPRDFPGIGNAARARLDQYCVLLPRVRQLSDLNGRTLEVRDEALTVV